MYAHLLADADVNAVVGGRIRKQRAYSEDALPYIVLHIVSGDHIQNMEAGSGLVSRRMQINSYSTTYELAWVLAEHVRDAIQTFRGTLGSGANTLDVRSIELDGEGDIDIEPASGPQRGSQNAPNGVRQDYIVWHAESVPA
jgi:hypothetical protein